MIHHHKILSLLLVVLLTISTTTRSQAFVLPPHNTANAKAPGVRQPSTKNSPTQKQSFTSTGWDSFEKLRTVTDVPSGEGQRKFRRTVYSHDDWKKHRSQDRFIFYLQAIFSSGVYKNLQREVTLTCGVAVFVCLYNALFGGYTDWEGVQQAALIQSQYFPKIGLPLAAFTLTSPSLGLLLVFRTNTSYQRWDEARKNWGMNINHTRNLNRMANAYYDPTANVTPEQRQADLTHVAVCTWAFVRAMKRHLSPEEEDEAAFVKELYDRLPAAQAEKVVKSAHRPNRALQDLSYAIEDLPMHYLRKNEVHRAVTIFEDNLGSSERILTSPVPLFYSRHLARFLAVWLLLLPFGLYDAFAPSWNHMAMIPATVVISTMLFGIEEIGTQLEEPFTVLPMQAFCDKIYNWCTEIQSWQPGDNGRPAKPVRPQHALYFTEQSVGMALPMPPPTATMVNGDRAAPVMAAKKQPTPVAKANNNDNRGGGLPPPSSPSQLSMEEFLKRQAQGGS
ncbi:hypothetical protein ACA910_001586 [Epithemia clementina (nom. ined.)]